MIALFIDSLTWPAGNMNYDFLRMTIHLSRLENANLVVIPLRINAPMCTIFYIFFIIMFLEVPGSLTSVLLGI